MVLTPLQLNSSSNGHHEPTTNGLKSSASFKSSSNQINSNTTNSTDTDDAKIISSRNRTSSCNQELSSSNSTSSITMTNQKNFYSNSVDSEVEVVKRPSRNASTSSVISESFINSSNNSSFKQELNWNTENSKNGGNLPIAASDALANLVKQYGVSKRNALIKWCQERMNSYKGIEIKNFSSSWNDGLAFCALLHSFMPLKVDYETLRHENNPVINCNLFFI